VFNREDTIAAKNPKRGFRNDWNQVDWKIGGVSEFSSGIFADAFVSEKSLIKDSRNTSKLKKYISVVILCREVHVKNKCSNMKQTYE
jgi:hypothetical protein